MEKLVFLSPTSIVTKEMLFCLFWGPNMQDMELPGLGVKSELQLLVYELPVYITAAATASEDPSCVCTLPHSSRQGQILHPLGKARDRTCVLMHPSQVPFHWARTGTPESDFNSMGVHERVVGAESLVRQVWRGRCPCGGSPGALPLSSLCVLFGFTFDRISEKAGICWIEYRDVGNGTKSVLFISWQAFNRLWL